MKRVRDDFSPGERGRRWNARREPRRGPTQTSARHKAPALLGSTYGGRFAHRPRGRRAEARVQGRRPEAAPVEGRREPPRRKPSLGHAWATGGPRRESALEEVGGSSTAVRPVDPATPWQAMVTIRDELGHPFAGPQPTPSSSGRPRKKEEQEGGDQPTLVRTMSRRADFPVKHTTRGQERGHHAPKRTGRKRSRGSPSSFSGREQRFTVGGGAGAGRSVKEGSMAALP